MKLPTKAEISAAAAAMGRNGNGAKARSAAAAIVGRNGAKSRAAKMTAEERAEHGRMMRSHAPQNTKAHAKGSRQNLRKARIARATQVKTRRAEIMAKYRKLKATGLTDTAIAAELGLHPSAISRLLLETGQRARRKKKKNHVSTT